MIFFLRNEKGPASITEPSLQESYDHATATASVLIHHLKTNDKPLPFNDAYAFAQEHLEKEDKAIQKHTKTLSPEKKDQERIRLKEKSRLQNQFGKELNPGQDKQLIQDVNHHQATPTPSQAKKAFSAKTFSIRQKLFCNSHDLKAFQQNSTYQKKKTKKESSMNFIKIKKNKLLKNNLAPK